MTKAASVVSLGRLVPRDAGSSHATPELGDRVVDRLTGFKGIAVMEKRWLFGSRTLAVNPEDATEQPTTAYEFDALRLEVVDKAVFGPDR